MANARTNGDPVRTIRWIRRKFREPVVRLYHSLGTFAKEDIGNLRQEERERERGGEQKEARAPRNCNRAQYEEFHFFLPRCKNLDPQQSESRGYKGLRVMFGFTGVYARKRLAHGKSGVVRTLITP